MTQQMSSAQQAARREAVRAMSEAQLAELGLKQLAYIRPVMMNGALAYAVHGADGTTMGVAPDRGQAAEAIEQNELVQVLVH